MSYSEVAEDTSHWSVQLNIIGHVLFPFLTQEEIEMQLDILVLFWCQGDLMTLGYFSTVVSCHFQICEGSRSTVKQNSAVKSVLLFFVTSIAHWRSVICVDVEYIPVNNSYLVLQSLCIKRSCFLQNTGRMYFWSFQDGEQDEINHNY